MWMNGRQQDGKDFWVPFPARKSLLEFKNNPLLETEPNVLCLQKQLFQTQNQPLIIDITLHTVVMVRLRLRSSELSPCL